MTTQPGDRSRSRLFLAGGASASPDTLVAAAEPAPVTSSYPRRGIGELWALDADAASAGPSALIGRSRAVILAILDHPMNATEAAEQTGLSRPRRQ